jgi:hypothetical protein
MKRTTYPMYITVCLSIDLLASRPFIYEPEDLPVCPERAGGLDAGTPPSILLLTLI